MHFLGLARLLIGVAGLVLAPLAQPSHVSAASTWRSQELIDRINQVRFDAGLDELAEDASLDGVAAERSGDMAERQYFSHQTPDGTNVFDLMHQRGIQFAIAGENLAWSRGGIDYPLAMIVRSFMDSPAHRDILLNPSFSRIGIGVASEGESLFFTVLLRD